MNDVTKICKYFTFNKGKSYTSGDVQVTDKGGQMLVNYDFIFTAPEDAPGKCNFNIYV